MRTARSAALLAAVVVVLSSAQLLAGEAAAPATRKIKIQVKQYRPLASADIYKAAADNRQVEVRFRDTFRARINVPRSVQRVDVGGYPYLVAMAFRTGGDLVCLVPRESTEALYTLLGVPLQLPLTSAALDGPLALNPGQQITIEGTIVGVRAADKVVLVEAVYLGEPTRRDVHREVHLFWPSQAEPRMITAAGTQSFEFPCNYEQGKTDKVEVAVQQMTQDQVASEVAKLQAELEGVAGGRKTYGSYSAGVVYRYASGRERVNVDFTDSVSSLIGPPMPRELGSVLVTRAGIAGQMPVVRAFEMTSRTMVLIPQSWPTLLLQATNAVPGETVRVRGTVVGPLGVYNCVLADYLDFPDRQAGGEPGVWWVSVQWPNTPGPVVFWDYGRYPVVGLPCQNAAGRFEQLQVLVSQFREIDVPVPPVPEQPARPAAPPAAVPNPEG